MTQEEVLQKLQEVGAIITDSHVVYTSGRHGTDYVNKDAAYPHTLLTFAFCENIAKFFVGDQVDVVIAPAIGGVILSQWIAYHLSTMTGRKVLGVYAERQVVPIPDPQGANRHCYAETGDFVIKRGYNKLIENARTIVVEDVLNTGGSANKVIEAVRRNNGEVIGLGALCNRGGVTPDMVGGVPKLVALINVTLDSWAENEMPQWLADRPVNTDVGKGRDYLARKSQS